MKKNLLTLVISLFAFTMPIMAIVNGRSLPGTLKELCTDLKTTWQQRTEAQRLFNEDNKRQHQKLIDIIAKANKLYILLYTQEQEMTFDLAYALKKVSDGYKDFDKDKKPYSNMVSSLNYEIDRYGRLIKALHHLPDSFVLDEKGKLYRDSCIQFATEILQMHTDNLATVMADSIHYQSAYARMKEAYAYAEARYQELERYVFTEGQTPFIDILANPAYYWEKVKTDMRGQYNSDELDNDHQPSEPAIVEVDEDKEFDTFLGGLSSKAENVVLVVVCAIQLVFLVLTWLLTYLVIRLIFRFAKKLQRFISKKKLLLFSVLLGTVLYFSVFGFFWNGDEYIQLGVKHINTFLWLLIAISGSLLLRVKPEQIRHSLKLYSPTIFIALVIIVCRITFVPDRLMNYLFPPILFLVVLRQLFYCIRDRGRATSIDSTLGWVSLAIYLVTFVFAFLGYTFVALLILVWWYFQLAALLTIFCISDLLSQFKERWLNKRVDAMRNRITYVAGEDRESLLFGATWLYDFFRKVVIPTMILLSLPMCVHLSLNIFDFNDLFVKIYCNPFVQIFDNDGFETLRISCKNIFYLVTLFFILRYLSVAIHTIWRYIRYTSFMRKHNRTTIRVNEINLSLGNSIITALIWFVYAAVVVHVWRIPTGSLGLVAGGLSAGIGLALKDVINNFIYGIQLMGGQLRVGDWIECNGERGRVVSLNYQCVQIETIEGTEISFLNSTLFVRNYNNLTRNNSYELIKLIVGLNHGTDINRVREVLVEAMQQMRTKDQYGREIVDPKYGVYVVVEDMTENAVKIAVKQYILVAERIPYVDRSKEVIYEALNAAGIAVAFQQLDVHLIHEEKN